MILIILLIFIIKIIIKTFFYLFNEFSKKKYLIQKYFLDLQKKIKRPMRGSNPRPPA